MAISAGARGHPDHGIGGPSGISGHEAGTGVESNLGGSMIGPDSRTGMGPVGGYTGFFGQQYNQNMQNRYGQHQMHNFLQMMAQKYGHQSVRNFVDSYMGNIDSMSPQTMSYHEQAQELNFAPPGFGPAQGLGYDEGSGGNL